MRALCVLALLLTGAGCDDDSSGAPRDMASGGDDLPAGPLDFTATDATCVFHSFNGFNGVQTSETRLDCSCGCLVDGMDVNFVNPMWGASSMPPGSKFTPTANVGLGVALQYSGTVVQAGLYSVGPTAQFFLDGDFDLSVDYDLGATAPPGDAHLTLSVRTPSTVVGIPVYEIERAHLADGSDAYSTMLGGVPAATLPTTATQGTLRLVRKGFVLTSYGDGQQVSTLTAQGAGRVAVALSAVLNGCTTSDMGASCAFEPHWHQLRLASGTLVNLP